MATEIISSLLESEDLAQAVAAQQMLGQCRRAPTNDLELSHQIENIQTMFGTMDESWQTDGRMESAIQLKVMLLGKCRGLSDLRDRIWASDLYERASNGDQFARFLYAMWAPRETTSLQMSTDEMVVYQAAALEFTMQNLDEGHPLGMLAFGYSYLQSRYFTPGKNRLGVAYLVAAELCSNGQFGLQATLDEIFSSYEEHQFGASPFRAEEILTVGARIYDEHCASSIANSTWCI